MNFEGGSKEATTDGSGKPSLRKIGAGITPIQTRNNSP